MIERFTNYSPWRQEKPDQPQAEQVENNLEDPGKRRFIIGFAAMLLISGCEILDPRKKQTSPEKLKTRPKGPERPELNSAETELNLAMEIIRENNPERLLESRFLVASIYYSENFVETLSDQDNKIINYRMIVKIREQLNPEFVKNCLNYLSSLVIEHLENHDKGVTVKPLAQFEYGSGGNHPSAIDLFTAENSPIASMNRGIVVLAENSWDPKNSLATTSPKGGNAVIVFNPDSQEFYRYCHMSKVYVEPGEMVRPNSLIGSVGHTGTNAARPGHGNHLHLEIHPYDQSSEKISFLDRQQLRQKLSSLP